MFSTNWFSSLQGSRPLAYGDNCCHYRRIFYGFVGDKVSEQSLRCFSQNWLAIILKRMYFHFSQSFRNVAASGIIALLMFSGDAVAKASVDMLDNVSRNITITTIKNSGLILEVKQMPLARILETISKKLQVPIHYAELPETLVSVDCEGDSLKPILECLLENKADLIVRYQPKATKSSNEQLLSEVWILATNTNNIAIKPDVNATDNSRDKEPDVAAKGQNKIEAAMPDLTEDLLTKAQASNPDERAEAIGALLAGGRKGDPEVKATLERALIDPDAYVRAQAISSLAHREGNAASAAIQQALSDSSDEVRIMAVEAITDDIALLQQAINDSDESVRSLAEIKLELLTQDNSNP